MVRFAIALFLVLSAAMVLIDAREQQRARSDETDLRRDDAHRSYNQRSDNQQQGGASRSKSSYWKTKLAKERRLLGSRLPPPGVGASLNNYVYYSIWRNFKNTHNKSYNTSQEEQRRFHVFVANQRKIDQHNENYRNGQETFEVAMNKFGDMTNDEFRSRVNGFRRSLMDRDDSAPRGSTFLAPHHVQVPTEKDWRKEGYVTHVKDQGHCGSCWAFSAVGALEGQHFRKNKTMVELSEQNLVDCSTSFGNEGCNGGLMDNAFNYVKNNKGIDTETSYPYEAKDGRCRFNKATIGADDSGYTDIPQGDENALTTALATQGPISVAIDASHESFQFYKKGVYYEPECSPSQLDHGVLAVGYGVDPDGSKYYIVKNSWGTGWGEDGFIRMARDKENHCGIASCASYPNV